MSDYTTVEGVQAIMPGIGTISDTTKPTTDQVLGYITDITASMNGKVGRAGYTLPVTDATALTRLAYICANGVAAVIMRGSRGMDPIEAAAFERVYQDGLSSIAAGDILGLTLDGSGGSLPHSRYTDSPSYYPEPSFRFGTRQW